MLKIRNLILLAVITLTSTALAQFSTDIVSIGVQRDTDETTGRDICHHAMLSISNSASIAFAVVDGEDPAFVLARITNNPDELVFKGDTETASITFGMPDGSKITTTPTSVMIEDSVPGMLMDAAELLDHDLTMLLINTQGDVNVLYSNNGDTAAFTISAAILERARTGFATQCLD